MSKKTVVLDTNILIRAVLGNKTYQILEKYEDIATFYMPDCCYIEAARHLPLLLSKQHVVVKDTESFMQKILSLVSYVDESIYHAHKTRADNRIATRDPDDWPIVATALALNCPVWTEDQDFFGVGVTTWTTNTIHVYLEED